MPSPLRAFSNMINSVRNRGFAKTKPTNKKQGLAKARNVENVASAQLKTLRPTKEKKNIFKKIADFFSIKKIKPNIKIQIQQNSTNTTQPYSTNKTTHKLKSQSSKKLNNALNSLVNLGFKHNEALQIIRKFAKSKTFTNDINKIPKRKAYNLGLKTKREYYSTKNKWIRKLENSGMHVSVAHRIVDNQIEKAKSLAEIDAFIDNTVNI